MCSNMSRSLSFILVFQLLLAACNSFPSLGSNKVTIRRIYALDGVGEVNVNGELGLGFDVDAPDESSLTYEWIATGGTFRATPKVSKSSIYLAPGQPGLQIVTVRAIDGTVVVAEKSFEVSVIEPRLDEPTAEDSGRVPDDGTGSQAQNGVAPDWCIPGSIPEIPEVELQGDVEITFPKNCDEVSLANVITGTSAGIPDDEDIWVFVVPKISRLFPQSDAADQGLKITPDPDGRWSVTAYLGTPESGRGEKFDIVVMLADQEASDFFSKKLIEWSRTRDFPGLTYNDLPRGVKKVQTISVLRSQ